MPALNRVQIIGYLGRDPESRYTPKGKKVTHFSVAITQRWTGQDGAPKEATEWVNVELWEKLGEIAEKYLRKGSSVFLEGRLKTDKYEEKGETRYFTKVVGQMLQLLDRKAGEPAEQIEQGSDNAGDELY